MDNLYGREQDAFLSELAQLEKQAKRKELAERAEKAKVAARGLGLDRAVVEFQLFYVEGEERSERDIEEFEQKIEKAKHSK
jgi:hypothetical protein